jgi:hypothetical protein
MITSEQLLSLGKRRQSAITLPIDAPSGRLRECQYTRLIDTKSLIETGVNRFLDEVPALKPIKLVAGLELRARGDVQMYRIEMPGPRVTKDIAADAKVRLSVPRAEFNELAIKGRVKDWREAFAHGEAKATGIEQVLKLIVNVVERQEERARTRKARL